VSRILIVEDNPDLAFGLRKTLEFEGYDVDVAADGVSGLEMARSGAAELVLLDLMLPEMDGFKVLRALRGEGSRVPVLVLTARGDEADIVMGFDSGADDYVTKPFSTIELLARVRALLRRGSVATNGAERGKAGTTRFGDVEVDADARTVHKAGALVQLTPKEFDLLLALLLRHGAVASRAELLDEVWRYANTDVMTRTVDIHVAELRRKLEDDPARPRHLLTVRKAGYRLRV
jgi:DNA-binding response OmpR family regulator